MEIFVFFILFALFVLGALCLIVLEYQNQRTRKWQQTLPETPSHISQANQSASAALPSQKEAISRQPAQVA